MKWLVLKILLFTVALLLVLPAISCSGYKITLHGKTMVGSNEDAWRSAPRIWFEAGSRGQYGAVFTGNTDTYTQSGMNEHGLWFDGFSVLTHLYKPNPNKKAVEDRENFLKGILKTCRTVSEVYQLLFQYQQGFFTSGLLWFIDRDGNYLFVEPDTLVMGKDPKYVLANFCPSHTPHPEELRMNRYNVGQSILENRIDTSFAFCRSVSEAMKVCRPKLGDGTLYTTIYDLKEGKVALYFYHDFKHPLYFSIKEELKKGDHLYEIPNLFPENKEFKALLNYKTPVNSQPIFLMFMGCMLVFGLLCGFFMFTGVSELFRTTKRLSGLLRLFIGLICWMMASMSYNLLTDQSIVYLGFNHLSRLGTFISFTPSILLICLIPLAFLNIYILKQGTWRLPGKIALVTCTLLCFSTIPMLTYWGLMF